MAKTSQKSNAKLQFDLQGIQPIRSAGLPCPPAWQQLSYYPDTIYCNTENREVTGAQTYVVNDYGMGGGGGGRVA